MKWIKNFLSKFGVGKQQKVIVNIIEHYSHSIGKYSVKYDPKSSKFKITIYNENNTKSADYFIYRNATETNYIWLKLNIANFIFDNTIGESNDIPTYKGSLRNSRM